MAWANSSLSVGRYTASDCPDGHSNRARWCRSRTLSELSTAGVRLEAAEGGLLCPCLTACLPLDRDHLWSRGAFPRLVAWSDSCHGFFEVSSTNDVRLPVWVAVHHARWDLLL
jgi:hypothetical protein